METIIFLMADELIGSLLSPDGVNAHTTTKTVVANAPAKGVIA